MAKTLAVAAQPITPMDRLKAGPARLSDFLKDVRAEMKKVITPSQAEVKTTTIVVIATVFIFAVFFAVVDSIAGKAIELVFNHLAKT
jgi:preprotein translocase subunit SecE